jgi:aminopeptidase N
MQTVSRLIDQFVPEQYQLSLRMQRLDRTFDGIVTLKGVSPSSTGTILVHAKELTIESATIDGKAASWTMGTNDELTVTHPDITAGEHILVIAFKGAITDAMHGLYPCFYEHDGIKKELLATQFESHHAREVFPCIDEPEAKATFDVTLTTEQDVTVLGNMPIKQQAIDGEQLVTTFITTPRMSTYLLAWVTGELHRKTATTKNGVEVNVWATPAQPLESLDFALDIATRTIDFFDDYFGVTYPLPKSDHVALPDFSSGAMENWGLVTYREVALIADPATVSVSSKHYIATVIAHELSHQWFGNLVTMKWWNNLWLNESFATLMEYIAIDALHPEWDVWLDFSTMESIMALRRDSIEGVQAVQIDVHHPDEISTLFDASIVYAKGARLLRMLQQYIGHRDFQTGLQAYFAAHSYANTEGDDLWKALGAASGKDISHFMDTWISQSGYPKVSVSQKGTEITLQQAQFFVGPHAASSKLWPIPLNPSDPLAPALFDTSKLSFTSTSNVPLRLNVGDSAHFVTEYDSQLLTQHIEQIKTGHLAPLDRLQLLHEQTLLARGGDISSASLIPLLDAYKHETTESVWDIVSLASGELRKFVENDPVAEQKLRMLSRDLARAEYTRLGWTAKKDETETDTKLRSTIISMMVYGEEKDAINKALQLYSETSLEKLDSELRSIILATAVRHSVNKSKTIDTLIEKYKTTSSADLQQDIAAGLAATNDALQLARLLDLIKDDTTVRPQNAGHWFLRIVRNRHGRTLAWQWLRTNWTWVEETFGGDKSYDDYPRFAASALVTRAQLEEYRDFFGPMQIVPALSRVISIGISEIEGRIELIERDSTAVCEVLRKL